MTMHAAPDAKTIRLAAIRRRHFAAPTDWSRRETSDGSMLYARIIPPEPPIGLVQFTGDCGDETIELLLYAHEDEGFLLELLDEAFRVIRQLRGKQQKPKDYAAECAMKCGEPAFQRFLAEMHGLDRQNKDSAASRVRSILMIESRTEINTNPAAAEGWIKLRDQFNDWMKPR